MQLRVQPGILCRVYKGGEDIKFSGCWRADEGNGPCSRLPRSRAHLRLPSVFARFFARKNAKICIILIACVIFTLLPRLAPRFIRLGRKSRKTRSMVILLSLHSDELSVLFAALANNPFEICAAIIAQNQRLLAFNYIIEESVSNQLII